jgi:hypothetical protein
MQQFLTELPALIITVAVLAMATVLLLLGHVAIGDVITLVSPVIAFWFIGKAYAWSPSQQQSAPLQGVAQQEKTPQ